MTAGSVPRRAAGCSGPRSCSTSRVPGCPGSCTGAPTSATGPTRGSSGQGPPSRRSSLDTPWPLTLLPAARGRLRPARPGSRGSAAGTLPRGRCSAARSSGTVDRLQAQRRRLRPAGFEATAELLVLEPSGVLRVRGLITNGGGDALDVAAVRLLMPLPPRAGEVLDQTGRWAREASPQRLPFALREPPSGLPSRPERATPTVPCSSWRGRQASASGPARSGVPTSPGPVTASTSPNASPRVRAGTPG